jgi:hypothetical protein
MKFVNWLKNSNFQSNNIGSKFVGGRNFFFQENSVNFDCRSSGPGLIAENPLEFHDDLSLSQVRITLRLIIFRLTTPLFDKAVEKYLKQNDQQRFIEGRMFHQLVNESYIAYSIGDYWNCVTNYCINKNLFYY